ncbi:unnamed protein product [Phytomonas sp. EM1]|nr:unnamed protein product [Phytomonas sp. EM1]|eukprot:CCW60331.1 unnamed protein product [Phytomonas sp. isolate EM1]
MYILDTSNVLPLLLEMTPVSATQHENVDVYEDKVSTIMHSPSLESTKSAKQLICKSTHPLTYGLPVQSLEPFHNSVSEIPQRNALMMEAEKYSQDCYRTSPPGLLSYDEGDVLKQFGFDGSSPSVSQLSIEKRPWISESKLQKKTRQSHRKKDSGVKGNNSCCKAINSTLRNEDDIPLYLRFSKTILSASQENGSNFEENCQKVPTVSRKRQRTSSSRALETSFASNTGPVGPFKKKRSLERREELNKEQLVVPQPCMLPHNMACLFVEVCNDDYTDDVRAAALRRLLAYWSGAMEGEALPGISKGPRIESSTSFLPPLHRRLIVLIADNMSALERSLLWWTLRPYAEHALILPIFGICPIGDDEECSACAPTSKESSDVRGSQEGKRVFPQTIRKSELSTKASQAVRHNDSQRRLPVGFTLLQAVALHHLCDSFAVNTSNSYALCYSKVCWDVLRGLGIPTHHMKRSLEECAQCIIKACTGSTKASRRNEKNTANVGFGLWLGAGTAAQQRRCDENNVDEQREVIFSYLCSWNGLAQTLATNARRPELVLRVVKMLHSPISSFVLSVRICYALVRPVSTQGLCFACAISRDMRLFASQSPLVVLPTRAVELFRNLFFKYLSAFFTPSIFRTAVDVVRSSSPDYIKGYSCSTLGYLQFEVTSWLRQYVYVSLVVDLRPIVAHQALNNNSGMSLWGCVLRALQCSCTPREHEKILFSENGVKKCRHHAELLYYFVNRQINTQIRQ